MNTELAAYGLVTGILSTVTGQGGSLFLLLALSARTSPHAALALSAPALLLGNIHRAVAFRADIDWAMAKRFSLGAFPGAVVGGVLATAVPDTLLRALFVVATVLALAKAFGCIEFSIPQRWHTGAGFSVGFLTGTSGGAAILIAPVMLASGLSGRAFIATQSLIALAIHVGRTLAYGTGGMFHGLSLVGLVAVTGALFAGNVVAERIRRQISARTMSIAEYGTMVICSALAVLGVGQ